MLTHRQSLAALILGLLLMLFGSAVPAAQVNINTADAATLARELTGIGLKRAQTIVEYRQKHGPFQSADELALVKGIGAATIAKNRALIRVDGGARPVAPAPAATAKPGAVPVRPVTPAPRPVTPSR
jgi:competence protein ComEA